MGFHVVVILGLVLICIVFGLVRAELAPEDSEENPVCKSCDECGEDEHSCGHFCFRRPATDVRRLLKLE